MSKQSIVICENHIVPHLPLETLKAVIKARAYTVAGFEGGMLPIDHHKTVSRMYHVLMHGRYDLYFQVLLSRQKDIDVFSITNQSNVDVYEIDNEALIDQIFEASILDIEQIAEATWQHRNEYMATRLMTLHNNSETGVLGVVGALHCEPLITIIASQIPIQEFIFVAPVSSVALALDIYSNPANYLTEAFIDLFLTKTPWQIHWVTLQLINNTKTDVCFSQSVPTPWTSGSFVLPDQYQAGSVVLCEYDKLEQAQLCNDLLLGESALMQNSSHEFR